MGNILIAGHTKIGNLMENMIYACMGGISWSTMGNNKLIVGKHCDQVVSLSLSLSMRTKQIAQSIMQLNGFGLIISLFVDWGRVQ